MRFKTFLNEESIKDFRDYVMTNKMLKSAISILNDIEKKKYKAYIVGGTVRDIILGISPKDIDIATNMPIEEISKMYKTYDIGKSKDFGIVVINKDGFSFEIAQFRKDGKYLDNRRPDTVEIVGSFQDDASRRDFTINSMGIDKTGNIIDYFDGTKDIKNKQLRTVGDPKKRFGEDALRIMRAARFSARFNMDIEQKTGKTMKNLASQIQNLSNERIRDELLKAAYETGDKFSKYIEILDRYKILKYVLPEVQNLKYFRQSLKHHPEGETGDNLSGSIWTHTLKTLKHVEAKKPIEMFATLIHDVGKGITFDLKDGVPTYYRHAEEGIKLVNSIADRLKFSNKDKEALLFATSNHMKFHKLLDMKPSKIAKLVNDDNWDVLVTVARSDEFSRGDTFMYKGEFEKIIDKAVEIKKKWGKKQLENTSNIVSGHRIMKLLDISPSKRVGEIKRKVMEYIIDNNIKNQKEIETAIIKIGNDL